MTWKTRLKRTVALAIGVLSLIALVSPAVAPAAPKFPDLRTLPPRDLHLGMVLANGENHYVVRFTNFIANAGTGPLEIHGTPHFPPDGLFDATQWIYDDVAGVTIEPVGTFEFHTAHQHFHFADFARYELWKQRDFDRAAARGFTSGQPLYVSPKVSFCVLDLYRYDTSTGPPVAVYRTCSPAMEGISPGWADVYEHTLPDQYVDVGPTPLPDGNYVIRSIADPSDTLFESAGKRDRSREDRVANSAATSFTIVNGRLAGAP